MKVYACEPRIKRMSVFIYLRRKNKMAHSKTKKLNLFKKYNGRCAYCGCEMDWDNFHIDHVIPKSKGGNGTYDNLVATCPTCNLYKGTLSVEEFKNKILNLVISNSQVMLFTKYIKCEIKKPIFHFEKVEL
jgi:uncharacterized protein (TIGR02646 family)